ncbi:MAG TPA: acyltransferase family protein, partial [Elusimicrobiota bacterium]|nr:acyltransferase family protein [Elusimicrobiota bacterium]
VSNFLLWREAGYFDKAAGLKPLLHLWSIAVEEQFYLTWPLLLAAAHRRRWSLPALIGALFAASFAWCLWRSPRGADAFYLLPSRYWELMLGCGLAYAEHVRPGRESSSSDAAAAAAVLLLAGALLFVRGTAPYPGWAALAPTLAAVLFIRAGEGAWLNRRALSLGPAVLLGRISYPLYLWHWPLLCFARIVEGGTPGPAVRAVVAGLSFPLAWLTWRLVERPLREGPFGALSGPAARRRLLFAGAAGLLAMGFLGGAASLGGGFPGRYPKLEAARAEIAWPRAATAACDKRYGLPDDAYCRESGGVPRVVVWGDSHADHLVPGLLADQKPGEFPLIQLGKGDCPPLLGVEQFRNGVRYDCLPVNEAIRDRIIVDFESARVVILSSQIPLDFLPADDEGNRWDFAVEPPAGRRLSQEESFKLGLTRAVDFLEARGKTVVIALDVPELGFDPASCVAGRPFAPARRGPAACFAPRAEVDARQEAFRRVLARLRSTHPRLRVFDPVPALCGAAGCSAVRDGRLLYRDRNHLSVEGSRLVAKPLIELLRRLDLGGRGPMLRYRRP